MGLHISNERVQALAREAARLTGQSQTKAIGDALELLLRERGHDTGGARARSKIALVAELASEYRADAGDRTRTILAVEDLCDDATGLPR
ncbi:type II toxin-antitoxin system VapB family antitoxin [Knoellia sinensis]|nr:type II toxin-antitoxin system VapB family antitoxin [Knoellia sinensis]